MITRVRSPRLFLKTHLRRTSEGRDLGLSHPMGFVNEARKEEARIQGNAIEILWISCQPVNLCHMNHVNHWNHLKLFHMHDQSGRWYKICCGVKEKFGILIWYNDYTVWCNDPRLWSNFTIESLLNELLVHELRLSRKLIID